MYTCTMVHTSREDLCKCVEDDRCARPLGVDCPSRCAQSAFCRDGYSDKNWPPLPAKTLSSACLKLVTRQPPRSLSPPATGRQVSRRISDGSSRHALWMSRTGNKCRRCRLVDIVRRIARAPYKRSLAPLLSSAKRE